MVCPKCRKNLSGSPSFCGYCGTKLAKAPAPQVSQPKREAQPVKVYENPVSENVAKCPMCGSTSLQAMKKGVSVKKAAAGAILVGPLGLLAGGLGMNDTKIVCLNCGHEINR